MKKRLQVLLDETEMAEIHAAARSQRMTTSEWVRRALRKARRFGLAASQERKLEFLRKASRHSFPAPDIDQMLAETSR